MVGRHREHCDVRCRGLQPHGAGLTVAPHRRGRGRGSSSTAGTTASPRCRPALTPAWSAPCSTYSAGSRPSPGSVTCCSRRPAEHVSQSCQPSHVARLFKRSACEPLTTAGLPAVVTRHVSVRIRSTLPPGWGAADTPADTVVNRGSVIASSATGPEADHRQSQLEAMPSLANSGATPYHELVSKCTGKHADEVSGPPVGRSVGS